MNYNKADDIETYNRHELKRIETFVNFAKTDFKPYDYEFILNGLKVMLEHMLDYYSEGYNVHQIDESRLKIVTDLKTALEKLDACKNADLNNELELISDFFDFLSKNITKWWD